MLHRLARLKSSSLFRVFFKGAMGTDSGDQQPDAVMTDDPSSRRTASDQFSCDTMSDVTSPSCMFTGNGHSNKNSYKMKSVEEEKLGSETDSPDPLPPDVVMMGNSSSQGLAESDSGDILEAYFCLLYTSPSPRD